MTAVLDRRAELVVGRPAVDAEFGDLAQQMTRWGIATPGGHWQAAVVAVVDGNCVGVAVAVETQQPEVAATAAVHPSWLGLGVGRFLGRLLAEELLRTADACAIVLAPPSVIGPEAAFHDATDAGAA